MLCLSVCLSVWKSWMDQAHGGIQAFFNLSTLHYKKIRVQRIFTNNVTWLFVPNSGLVRISHMWHINHCKCCKQLTDDCHLFITEQSVLCSLLTEWVHLCQMRLDLPIRSTCLIGYMFASVNCFLFYTKMIPWRSTYGMIMKRRRCMPS